MFAYVRKKLLLISKSPFAARNMLTVYSNGRLTFCAHAFWNSGIVGWFWFYPDIKRFQVDNINMCGKGIERCNGCDNSPGCWIYRFFCSLLLWWIAAIYSVVSKSRGWQINYFAAKDKRKIDTIQEMKEENKILKKKIKTMGDYGREDILDFDK